MDARHGGRMERSCDQMSDYETISPEVTFSCFSIYFIRSISICFNIYSWDLSYSATYDIQDETLTGHTKDAVA